MRRDIVHIVLTGVILSLLSVSCGEKMEVVDSTASLVPRKTELTKEAGSVVVKVTASGSWTISLVYPSGTAEEWGTMDPASGTGNKADVRFRYTANTGEDSRKVTLVLKTKGSLPVEASLWQSGNPQPVTPDPGSQPAGGYGDDVSAAGWLEIPATVAGDGREVLTHNMDGGRYKSGEVRNWSCYWDYDEHVSIWVAYPLNPSLIGSGSRTNAWGLDPLLPSSIQPNLTSGSYGGGWTRGHQIPSADRLTYKANVSTFYGTNMTPQEYDFNTYIWADLETRVRKYASVSDTLYVVTGCVLDGSNEWSGSNSGFSVRVPSAYFKALLYKGSSTYASSTDGYLAAGYYLPHSASIARGNFLDYLMSVDDLEKKTGIDFFPNLVTVLGKDKADKIEAATPSTFWK